MGSTDVFDKIILGSSDIFDKKILGSLDIFYFCSGILNGKYMIHRYFKRKLYERMLEWKNVRKGETALLIEGARRVGKSTLVAEFAKNEYDSYILIDFNKTSQKIKSLFEDLMNLDYIFLQLQAIYGVTLKERRSVIVFDEVQNCPLARQAIKYLVQDHGYDYIETGSLIIIKKNTKNITIPSEEERVSLYPLDYEEFLWALGDSNTLLILKTFFEKRIPLDAAFRKNLRDFRLYMLVGGMPQAVNEYLKTNNLSMVDRVKRNIINLYRDDFQKLDPSGRVERLFMNIPAQLSQTSNRFKPSQVIGDTQDDKLLELLHNLEDSKTTLFSYHANDPQVGLAHAVNNSRFKIYCCDTGLFVTLAFWDKNYTENIIYDKLLNDKLSANLGYVYENIVAQMLRSAGNNLFYYTFPKDEKHNYEIDFILSRGSKLCPIEVKSSGYKSHASIDAFKERFSDRISQCYLLYTKDLKKNQEVLLLPVFMTMFL